MNLIQYRLTDKPRFFLLKDVPEKREYCFTFSGKYPCDGNNEGAEKEGYCKCYEYMEQLELCESEAIEIVNPEVLPITLYHNSEAKLFAVGLNDPYTVLKHGDTFPVPTGWEMGNITRYMETGSVASWLKVEEPVKEETQEDSMSGLMR